MSSNKINFVIEKDDILLQWIEKAEKDIREVTEKALKASKQLVTQRLDRDTVKPNFPHQGIYSNGTLKESIDRNYSVEWEGMTASINVGYDFSKSGMESIYLLKGTPNKTPSIPAAKILYDDIYGNKIRKETRDIQKKTILKILQR